MSKFLIERGTSEDSKNSSLIPAAHFGHLPVVKLLLDSGANENFSNKKGTTALMRAAQEGRESVVSYLLEHGAQACCANVSCTFSFK